MFFPFPVIFLLHYYVYQKFDFRFQLLFFFILAASCSGQTEAASAPPQIGLNATVESRIAAGAVETFRLRLESNQVAVLILEIGDRDNQIESSILISRILYDRGDFTESNEILNQASALAAESHPDSKAIIHNQLATNHIFLGQMQKALDYLQQSLRYYREISGNKWNEAATLEQIAQIYSNLGRSAQSIEYNRQATAIYSNFGCRDAVVRVAVTNRMNHRALKNYDKAKEAYLEALKLAEDSVKIVESLRAEIISRASHTAYFSTVRDKYDFYIGLLIELRFI